MAYNGIHDRCNMAYKQYINQTMSMCERKIIINFARNPHLINSLDRNKNQPLKKIILIYHLIINDKFQDFFFIR